DASPGPGYHRPAPRHRDALGAELAIAGARGETPDHWRCRRSLCTTEADLAAVAALATVRAALVSRQPPDPSRPGPLPEGHAPLPRKSQQRHARHATQGLTWRRATRQVQPLPLLSTMKQEIMQGVATGVLPNKLSTRLTRPLPVWRYALIAILVACAGTLHAAPTSAACREAQSTLDALSVELEHLSRRHQQLLALRQDTLPADASLTDVLAVDLSNDSAVQAHLQKPSAVDSLDDWPDSVDCRELAPRYQETLDDGRWLVHAIQREKQQWLGLPATLRSALVALWQSRQQLAMEYEALASALRESNSQIEPGDTQPGAIQAQSHAQRADLLALLAQADQLDSEHINAFFTLWHTLLATPLPSYQQD